MKQKVVIKVCMKDKKSRKKALSTVVGHSGVQSTALKGQEKDQIEVVGEIDAVALTTSLRKKVGYAELVSVSAVDDKKDDGDKKETNPNSAWPNVIWSTHPYVYSGAPYHTYAVRDCSYDPNCTIM